jgi:hypothetical protein
MPIETILQEFAEKIRFEARKEILDQLSGMKYTMPPETPAALPSVVPSSPVPPVDAASIRRIPPHCLFPKCTNPHKGPRFSFMCAEHEGTPKAARAIYLAEWKGEKSEPKAKGRKK